jgi:hypothetical protein
MSENGYTGWELGEQTRNELRERFPPKYEEFVGHHVTHAFGVTAEATPEPAQLQVMGYADDGSLECLVVSVNGHWSRPDGKTYHVTWSLDRSKGRKPFHSNMVLKQNGYVPVSPTINMHTTPRFFGKE